MIEKGTVPRGDLSAERFLRSHPILIVRNEINTAMKYQLHVDEPSAENPSGDFTTVAAADKWVREWLNVHAAVDRYLLTRDDGGFAANYVRNRVGQWYLLVEEGFTLAS